MARRYLAAAMLLVGAALVSAGVRSLVLSKSQLPEPPAVAVRSLPVEGESCCVLEVPRLKARMTIVEGTRPEDLERAPGHFIRSAAPGGDGNCAISAHRDTHFRPLRKIRKGDLIRITHAGRVFEYRVRSLRVIKPSDVWIVGHTPEPTLTLLTCYPFGYIGPAPKRFAVQATLIR